MNQVYPARQHGFWVYAQEKAYFFPFEEFPWFTSATISQTLQVEFPDRHRALELGTDDDFDVEVSASLETYPLLYRS